MSTKFGRNNLKPLKHRGSRRRPALHSTCPANGHMFDRDDWSGQCYALSFHGRRALCVDLLNVSSTRQVARTLHVAGIAVWCCSSLKQGTLDTCSYVVANALAHLSRGQAVTTGICSMKSCRAKEMMIQLITWLSDARHLKGWEKEILSHMTTQMEVGW